jgi:NADPH:quinone reductase
MKAIELTGLEGFQSMRVVEADKPKPGPNQVLIEVKAAGINFAELELTKGKYPALKPLPYILGFEAAGIVAELGTHVKNVSVGDKITAIVASGGFAAYCRCRRQRCDPHSQGDLIR